MNAQEKSDEFSERTVRVEHVYRGRVLDLDRLDVELEDGRKAVREIVRHAPSIGVLARKPGGPFAMVRQYRKAVEAAVVEMPAGSVAPGETPEETAKRELLEETGFRAANWRRLGVSHASPGYTDEVNTLFYAELDGEAVPAQGDEDERIALVWMDEEAIDRAMLDGRITDAKTMSAWCLYRLKDRQTGARST